MSDAKEVLEVVRLDDEERYELHVDGRTVGSAYFSTEGPTTVFVHTEVDPAEQHHGFATALIKGALDDVDRAGGTIVPQCRFVSAFLQRNPEYRRLMRRN